MSVLVVDASALGALVFGEPEAEGIAEMLSGASLVAPLLLPFELASICLKKITAHPSKRTLLIEAFELAGNLAIEYIEVEHTRVIALAEHAGLTTYDACYLWLARETAGGLVTLDAILRKAMRSVT